MIHLFKNQLFTSLIPCTPACRQAGLLLQGSSTSHGIDKALSHGMNDADPSVSLYPALWSNAFSVRCVRGN